MDGDEGVKARLQLAASLYSFKKVFFWGGGLMREGGRWPGQRRNNSNKRRRRGKHGGKPSSGVLHETARTRETMRVWQRRAAMRTRQTKQTIQNWVSGEEKEDQWILQRQRQR